MLQRRNKQYIKEKFSLGGLSVGLVLTNLFTTLIIARSLGFSLALDVYYITISMYLFLLASVGWSLLNVITPVLIEKGEKESISKVLYIVLTWVISIFFFLILFSPILTRAIYHNYLDQYSIEYLYILIFISFCLFVSDVLAQVLVCFENSSERFVRAIKVNFLSSLIGLSICHYLLEYYGIIGALLTHLSIKISLLFTLFVLNQKYLGRFHYDNILANELFTRSKYFFVSGFYYRTEDLFEKIIASFLSPGIISLVAFVQRIYGALITVINTVIITPSLTRFCKSETADEKHSDQLFAKQVIVLICFFSFISFPIVYYLGDDFLLLIFSDQLVGVEEYVTLTLTLLFPMFTLLTINQLLHNFLLSRSQEKRIAIYDMYSYSISLALKIVLTITYGVSGFLLGVMFASILKLTFKIYIVYGVVKNERKLNAA